MLGELPRNKFGFRWEKIVGYNKMTWGKYFGGN